MSVMTALPATPQHQLTPQLKQLRLSGVLETLDARQRQAIDAHWSYEDFLARLLADEIERRAQKQLAQRLRRGAINETKTFETFDFAAAPSLNRQQVLALAGGAYIRAKHNVLICGPTGTGKSHVAQGLAHDACRQGFDVLFVNTHRMLRHLNGGRADGTYDKRMATYLRPAVLILDDFGLKPLDGPAPADLYDIINERYEAGSIVLTSNRAPEEWPALFGDPLLASAGLDRLGHHAETLVMTGASFRARRTTPTRPGVTERDTRGKVATYGAGTKGRFPCWKRYFGLFCGAEVPRRGSFTVLDGTKGAPPVEVATFWPLES